MVHGLYGGSRSHGNVVSKSFGRAVYAVRVCRHHTFSSGIFESNASITITISVLN